MLAQLALPRLRNTKHGIVGEKNFPVITKNENKDTTRKEAANNFAVKVHSINLIN